MKSKLATLIAIFLLVTVPLTATDGTRWLNVHVTEKRPTGPTSRSTCRSRWS